MYQILSCRIIFVDLYVSNPLRMLYVYVFDLYLEIV